MDHTEHPTAALSATGWGIALIAAAIAGGLAMLVGAQTAAVAVVALVSFGVFGVLLGRGGVELGTATPDDHGHNHGDHH